MTSGIRDIWTGARCPPYRCRIASEWPPCSSAASMPSMWPLLGMLLGVALAEDMSCIQVYTLHV